MKSVDNTIALDTVDPSKFDAVFCVGGHGPMFDLPDNETLKKAVRTIYEKGGIASAVCHGPAGKWAFHAAMLKISKSCWLNVVATGTLRQQQRSPLLLVTLASFCSAPASLSELILIGWIPPQIWKTGEIPDKGKGIIIFPFFHFWSLGPAQICIKKKSSLLPVKSFTLQASWFSARFLLPRLSLSDTKSIVNIWSCPSVACLVVK